jgi:hypothetical protein
MTPVDAAAVLAIYQQGLDTGDASFETVAPPWPEWDAAHLAGHRFVAVDHGDMVVGWVALSAVSERCVYGGVAEVSVYVAEGGAKARRRCRTDARGHGVRRPSRPLDAAGWPVPGERGEHRVARAEWISNRGPTGANRSTSRQMA